MDKRNLKAKAAADQENARLRDDRAASKDGMTASERAMTESKRPTPAAPAAPATTDDDKKPGRTTYKIQTWLPEQNRWHTVWFAPADAIPLQIANQELLKWADCGRHKYQLVAETVIGQA